MRSCEGQSDPPVESAPEANYRVLVDFCERGMLYEAEAWLAAGNSARRPEHMRKCPLRIAVSRGFHSLVRLLLRYDLSPAQKHDAFRDAVGGGNLAICELLVAHGTEVKASSVHYLSSTFKRPLIEFLIENGLDLASGDYLAEAFVRQKQKSLLGIFLQHRERFPAWEEQAAMALCMFVREENLKWISLMIWAKADPMRPVFELRRRPRDGSDFLRTHAAELAAWSDKPAIFKSLKLDLTPEQASALLYLIWYHPHPEIVEILLAAGADLHYREPGGGSLLDRAIHSFSSRAFFESTRNVVMDTIDQISFLIRSGIKWIRPQDDSDFKCLRRYLHEQDETLVVEVIRMLHAGKVCPVEWLIELTEKRKIRGWIQMHEPALALALGYGPGRLKRKRSRNVAKAGAYAVKKSRARTP